MTWRSRQSAALYALFFGSGAAGLGYQIVWSKLLGVGLGHELPAALAVVAAFMGGMSLGAWLLDDPIHRARSPQRWYGGLELTIGFWALASAWLIPLASPWMPRLAGVETGSWRHWTIAFLFPWLALLPATAAMGATLPAMARWMAFLAPEYRKNLGALYAANTFGAVAGIFAGIYVLAPKLGFTRTLVVLAGLNLACGVGALLLPGVPVNSDTRSNEHQEAKTSVSFSDPPRPGPPFSTQSVSRLRLYLTLFVTGLLGIGCEVVGVRVMSQVLENTVYTFAVVLSVYLFGTAFGAALYQRFGSQLEPRQGLGDLSGALALAILLGTGGMSQAQPIYDAVRGSLGTGGLGVFAAELTVAAAGFGLPTLAMGALFAHLAQAARQPAGGLGKAVALNTLGGAFGPALFGVVLLPRLGSKWTWVMVVIGYLALLPKPGGWRWGWIGLPLALLPLLPASLSAPALPSPNSKLAAYREGVMASVAVIEEADGQRTLRVNNRFQMGGTAAAGLEYRHAHIPLLLHPNPRRALVLGLGTGITLGAASLHPELRTDGVELLPEIVELMAFFEPHNYAPARNPQCNLIIADARRFARVAATRYDVIIADLFHPARDGAGALYTREHFQAIRQRLKDDGLFCQWLPLHQLDAAMLRIVIRTFLDVFPEGEAWLLHYHIDAPVVGLIGRQRPAEYTTNWVEARLARAPPALQTQLQQLSLTDSPRLFGLVLAGPEALRQFAATAALNTDDHPRVTFGAPRSYYENQVKPYARLLSLLARARPGYQRLFPAEPDARPLVERLNAYQAARDVFLHGLVAAAEGRQEAALDAFVESSRLSADFTLGYAHCLSIASAQVRARPEAARALLRRLIAAQPARTVAAEMLRRWGEQ